MNSNEMLFDVILVEGLPSPAPTVFFADTYYEDEYGNCKGRIYFSPDILVLEDLIRENPFYPKFKIRRESWTRQQLNLANR